MPDKLHQPDEQVIDWQVALKYLEEGNRRFREKCPASHVLSADAHEAIKRGQKPFAVILTCSDSRVAPEIFFDEGLGDIFVIRNAGNIVDPVVLGSIEFATGVLRAPLVVVVGHSCCGAVIAALGGAECGGNLLTVVEAIRPAVANCANVDDAIRANVEYVKRQVEENDVVKKENVKVLGAVFSIESGAVEFM